MAKILWDKAGEHYYETGVDHGVLYTLDSKGAYAKGVAWNGLTTVTETPSGAEANAQWADNIKYLNLYSAEELGLTIEAFTYPDEFALCDGTAELAPGVSVGQQDRQMFGLSYRTKVGNDLEGNNLGYKLHLVYGCKASPSERGYATINDSPEPIGFSWEVSTAPISVEGHQPTSIVTIDSRKVDQSKLATLEAKLYGSDTAEPTLPLPDEIAKILGATSNPSPVSGS